MTAAAGTSDDTGTTDAATERLGVAPLSSLAENYDAMPDYVFKLRAKTVIHQIMICPPNKGGRIGISTNISSSSIKVKT